MTATFLKEVIKTHQLGCPVLPPPGPHQDLCSIVAGQTGHANKQS